MLPILTRPNQDVQNQQLSLLLQVLGTYVKINLTVFQ